MLQVNKFESCQEAATALVSEAYRLWLSYETRTDDITAAVIRVDELAQDHAQKVFADEKPR